MTWSRLPGALTACALAVLVVLSVGRAVTTESAHMVRSTPELQITTPPSAAPSSAQPVPGQAVTLTAEPVPETADAPVPAPRHAPAGRHAAAPPPVPSPTSEARPATRPQVLDFVISSFNVLGSSHTSETGKRPAMAAGRVRAARAAELVRRHDVDVVGFQELQGDQLDVLRRTTGMDFYPGSSMRHRDSENSLAWRRDTWAAVETRTLDIPYFNGNRRPMPYVRLRSLSTGLEAWFANFHNPADTPTFHRQQRYRDQATSMEIALVNRLVRDTGLPVFVTGDMNERDSYFCRMTSAAPMTAARGGSNNRGDCQAGHPRAVDWIFGSQGVGFSGYLEDRGALVRATTDHPMIVAGARIQGTTTASGTGMEPPSWD